MEFGLEFIMGEEREKSGDNIFVISEGKEESIGSFHTFDFITIFFFFFLLPMQL